MWRRFRHKFEFLNVCKWLIGQTRVFLKLILCNHVRWWVLNDLVTQSKLVSTTVWLPTEGLHTFLTFRVISPRSCVEFPWIWRKTSALPAQTEFCEIPRHKSSPVNPLVSGLPKARRFQRLFYWVLFLSLQLSTEARLFSLGSLATKRL